MQNLLDSIQRVQILLDSIESVGLVDKLTGKGAEGPSPLCEVDVGIFNFPLWLEVVM